MNFREMDNNDSNLNTSRDLQIWNAYMSSVHLPTTVLVTICFSVGLIANSTVLLVFIVRLRNSRDDRYFIPYLSTVDLLGLCLNVIGTWMEYFHTVQESSDSRSVCKLMWYFCSAIGCFSAFILIGIAIQRYLKICRPYKNEMTLKYRRIYLIVALLVSVGIAFPFIPFYDLVPTYNSKFNATGYVCKQDQRNWPNNEPVVYSITISSLIFLNISCLVILYSLIGRTIYQQTSQKKKRRSSARRRVGLLAKETNMDSEYPTIGKDHFHDDDVSENCEWPKRLDEFSSAADTRISPDQKAKTKSLKQYYQTLNKKVDRFTCMFLAITVVAMVSYIPKAAILIVESLDDAFWDDLTDIERSFALLIYRFHVLHHASNAFIYGYFDTTFRSEIRNAIRVILRK
jgi:hypothetical protein